MIRNILFDMGDVLIHFDRDVFLDRYDLAGADRTLLLREVYLSVEWSMLDRGSLVEEDMVRIVCGRIPERLHETARGLIMDWEKPLLPVEGMQELAEELKERGYRLLLLSNAGPRHHEYWPAIPVSVCFEDILISADLHLVKPQPEIYREAIRRFGIVPEETVFIDDNTLNIEGALNEGLHGIVFHQDAEELRRKLRELGVC